jgi:CTP synthase
VHAGYQHKVKVKLNFIDSEELEKVDNVGSFFQGCSGILVPGGFGDRGVEGKIKSIQYARENKIPFFGICLGMQLAVIEFARHVAKISDAHSFELDAKTANPVISLMAEQKAITNKGATMRLGAYPCTLEKNSLAFKAYGEKEISERHRHRYEFNNDYRQVLNKKGLILSGVSPDNLLVEIIEIKNHPWFLGCQFHPEFQSSPMKAHPLFNEFIGAAYAYGKQKDWIEKKAVSLVAKDSTAALLAEENEAYRLASFGGEL